MGEIVEFPVRIQISQYMAEELVKDEMRQHLGAAAGILHGRPTMAEIARLVDHLAEAAERLDTLMSIRRACGE